jgi:hypothetical protein
MPVIQASTRWRQKPDGFMSLMNPFFHDAQALFLPALDYLGGL